MSPVVILSITVVLLVLALFLNELRHTKIERALLDRVLEASGNRPIEEPKKPPVTKQPELKRKLVFPVRPPSR